MLIVLIPCVQVVFKSPTRLWISRESNYRLHLKNKKIEDSVSLSDLPLVVVLGLKFMAFDHKSLQYAEL